MTRSSREQFDAHAAKYAASAVHRSGPSLPVLVDLAAPRADDEALDVATGAGHTALALAPYVARVVGVDVSPKMLGEARDRAEREGVANAAFVEGEAERLPFPDAAFTLVTSRHAPHHFRDLAAFLRDARRVLRPGGRLVIADQVSPDAESRAWVDEWQRTRDPSHFAQRTIDEWRALAREAGFAWTAEQVVPYRLEFDWWVRQSGCTPERIEALRRLADATDGPFRAAYGLEFDGEGGVVAHHEPMLVVRLERA